MTRFKNITEKIEIESDLNFYDETDPCQKSDFVYMDLRLKIHKFQKYIFGSKVILADTDLYRYIAIKELGYHVKIILISKRDNFIVSDSSNKYGFWDIDTLVNSCEEKMLLKRNPKSIIEDVLFPWTLTQKESNKDPFLSTLFFKR